MTTKTRGSYSREFKLEAIQLLETSGKSRRQIEDELGSGHSCPCRRKQEFAEEGENAFPGSGRLSPDQERIRQLERENAILRHQRDILNTEVAIFSHPSK